MIAIYNKVEPLLYADVVEALKQTASNSRTKIKLKRTSGLIDIGSRSDAEWYIMSILFGGIKGGYLTQLLFNRRVRKMFNRILSICYLYLSHEENKEDISILQEIIYDISSSKEKFGEKEKSESFGKTATILQFGSVIVGIIVGVITIISHVAITLFPPFPFFFEFLVGTIIILALEIPGLYWTVPRIRWYRALIKMYEIKNKEMNVYDSLIPLERIVVSRAFPKIKGLLDEK